MSVRFRSILVLAAALAVCQPGHAGGLDVQVVTPSGTSLADAVVALDYPQGLTSSINACAAASNGNGQPRAVIDQIQRRFKHLRDGTS